MRCLADMKDCHRGRLIAVLGGGDSLLDDLKKVPRGALLVGINHHAILLDLDYVLFTDVTMPHLIRHSDAVRISNLHDALGPADILYDAPAYNYSGPRAVWVADWFGAERVLVCGCDDYTAERTYWHSHDLIDPERRTALANRSRDEWARCARDLQYPGRVEFLSGPLGSALCGRPLEAVA